MGFQRGSAKWLTRQRPSAGRRERGAARERDPEHTGPALEGSTDPRHGRLGSCWGCRVSGLGERLNQNPRVNMLTSQSHTRDSLSTDEGPFKPCKNVGFYEAALEGLS